MSVDFFELNAGDRRDALLVAAESSGRPGHLLEKDVWVVWALDHLFTAAYGSDLVFKGGTSLSKAYQAIERFSEDVDITYDIRRLVDVETEVPPNRSQAGKLTKRVRETLPAWIAAEIVPALRSTFHQVDPHGRIELSDNGENVLINYTPLDLGGSGYVSQRVLIEFGARSSGEPAEVRSVVCDAAGHVPDLLFPQAQPRVMRPVRTFWEKATAIHVFCVSDRFRGGKGFARHWYDVTRLWVAGYGREAVCDVETRAAVAAHKNMFFREKDRSNAVIDYMTVVDGALRLVPDEIGLAELQADFLQMVSDGMFLGAAPEFVEVMAICREIEGVCNKR